MRLVGIHSGRHGGKAVFNPIQQIELDFGTIYTHVAVYIDGPYAIYDPGVYTWTAMPSPSTYAYTYQWSIDYLDGNVQNLGTDQAQELSVTVPHQHFELNVTVTASTGATATERRFVNNNIGGGPERPLGPGVSPLRRP